ncbi:MAG: hypothetical protein R2939_12295 [Kofleriaceae bacterium]
MDEAGWALAVVDHPPPTLLDDRPSFAYDAAFRARTVYLAYNGVDTPHYEFDVATTGW